MYVAIFNFYYSDLILIFYCRTFVVVKQRICVDHQRIALYKSYLLLLLSLLQPVGLAEADWGRGGAGWGWMGGRGGGGGGKAGG